MNLGPSAPIADLPLDRLEHEIGELAAHIHAATCRWLLLVAEFDRREGWLAWGARSAADWLSWRCGVGPRAAREQVRVGARLAELPLVRDAFGRGELSYSKARALTRVATPETERELLDLAQHATAAQLELLVRSYRRVVSTQVEDVNSAHDSRYVSWEWDDDGSLLLRGRLPAEDGALLIKALEAARDQLRGGGGGALKDPPDPGHGAGGSAGPSPADHRDNGSAEPPAGGSQGDDSTGSSGAGPVDPARRSRPRASNADALSAMAETLLAGGVSQRPAGERYQVVLHVEPKVLSADAADGCCEIESGPAVPPETARRLACDASLVAIVERNGAPLGIGRKTRAIPPSLRRALKSRDCGCQFPGCEQRRFVDAHHIHHWARGGRTELANLLLLCRHHHRVVHEGGYSVERLPGGAAAFRRPDGRAIPAVPRNRGGSRRELLRRHRGAILPVSPEACVARSAGDNLDLGLAVEGMLAGAGMLEP